jgi:hypothetical protein
VSARVGLQNFVETGELVHKIDTSDGTTAVAWHPTQLILAFSGEGGASGMISIFGYVSCLELYSAALPADTPRLFIKLTAFLFLALFVCRIPS